MRRLRTKSNSESSDRSDHGTDRGGDEQSAATTSHRERQQTTAQSRARLERALHRDTLKQARQLKRKYRSLYANDPRRFRKIVKEAQSAVFRQKPGPKPDRQERRRIAAAARMLVRSANWPEVFERHMTGWREAHAVTRAYAEENFRRKVNKYRRSHRRRLKSKSGTVDLWITNSGNGFRHPTPHPQQFLDGQAPGAVASGPSPL